MSQPAAAAPRKVHPEEIYQAELAATEVGRGTARFLVGGFIAILFGIPISQAVLELRRGESIQALELFTPLRAAARNAAHGHWRNAVGALRPMVSRQNYRRFELRMGAASWVKNTVRPRLQELMVRWGGFGNETVMLGRDGWLYDEPSFAYVVGPDFRDPEYMRYSAKRMIDKEGQWDPTPDPTPAILGFARGLRARGIQLIVMPVPDKATLQPAFLPTGSGFGRETTPPNNVGYGRFVADLRAHGVNVFDCAPDGADLRQIRYLVQDTHWAPEFMQDVAVRLAGYIRTNVPLAVLPRPHRLRLEQRRQSGVGNLVDLLGLSARRAAYAPQTVTLQEVVDEDTGQPWTANAESDVLVLGDSFTNIFSRPANGWGQAAGLAEHLSYELQRPIDVIARDGAGVWGTRAELMRPDNLTRLACKKLVIYEFSQRYLFGENWRMIPLPPAEAIDAARAAAASKPAAADAVPRSK